MDVKKLNELKKKSKELRIKIFDYSRKHGGYHFGGSLSCVEILVTLFKNFLKEEDRFILSKGHAAFTLYPLLEERGHKPRLTEHPDMDIENGLWCTTGSLGMGLPTGVGMAKAKKLKGEPGKIYVVMGEGELQEGTSWESLLLARHHKLDNVVGIIDVNDAQGSGWVHEILDLGNIKAKLEAFGANVIEVDGHSIEEINDALNQDTVKGKCTMIIARTVKGKGVKVMEKNPNLWHAKFPTPKQMKEIYDDFGAELK